MQWNSVNQRQTLRLGTRSRREADRLLIQVENLIACRTANLAPTADTALWLAGVEDGLHDRLIRVGLAEPRGTP